MIGIVILNYNEWELSKDCIESIEKNTRAQYFIYLVDNFSKETPTDEMQKWLNNNSKVKIIYNKTNKGYSAGNNVGIKEAIDDDCDEILITNNDVIFSQGCIDGLKYALNNDKKIGIVGPKVLLSSGEVQEINMRCKTTLWGTYKYILRKTPFGFLTKKYVDYYHAKDCNLKQPFEVFSVSGCCFMMSKECSRKLYPLDEETFLYEEENIIGCRMEKLELKTYYYSPCTIIHLGGKSTKGMSKFAYKCFMKSEMYYFRKYQKNALISLLPLIIIRKVKYLLKYMM